MTAPLPTLPPGPAPLPGVVPALPGSTPTPHDPAADPFLALLTQLVGGARNGSDHPSSSAAPTGATGQGTGRVAAKPDDTEPSDGTDPSAPETPVATLPPQLAALVAAPTIPATPPVSATTVGGPTAADGPPVPAPTGDPTASPTTSPTSVPATAVPPVTPSGAAAPTAHAAAPAPAPVAHQVFPEVVRVVAAGDTPRRVVVRLEPEHLGEVRVVLRAGPDGLEVSLAADTDARAALREGAPELRRMLEAVGSADARILVRHLADAPAATTAPATAPAAVPTPVRTDATAGALTVNVGAGDVGAGTAGGTAHGDHRGHPQQDARTIATDGIPDRPLGPARPDRPVGGLDVMI